MSGLFLKLLYAFLNMISTLCETTYFHLYLLLACTWHSPLVHTSSQVSNAPATERPGTACTSNDSSPQEEGNLAVLVVWRLEDFGGKRLLQKGKQKSNLRHFSVSTFLIEAKILESLLAIAGTFLRSGNSPQHESYSRELFTLSNFQSQFASTDSQNHI